MKHRSTGPEAPALSTPECWQREASSACMCVELPSGESHLFPYQHFVSASLKRDDEGGESVRIDFSTYSIEVEGGGLRALLLDLQDFAVKRLCTLPERYRALTGATAGVVTSIRITAAE